MSLHIEIDEPIAGYSEYRVIRKNERGEVIAVAFKASAPAHLARELAASRLQEMTRTEGQG